MALPVIIHKRFSKRVEQVHLYLLQAWNEQVADAFLLKIEARMKALSANPELGMHSEHLKNVRSLSVTAHNRLFYKVYPDRIAILYLKDTRRKRYRR